MHIACKQCGRLHTIELTDNFPITYGNADTEADRDVTFKTVCTNCKDVSTVQIPFTGLTLTTN